MSVVSTNGGVVHGGEGNGGTADEGWTPRNDELLRAVPKHVASAKRRWILACGAKLESWELMFRDWHNEAEGAGGKILPRVERKRLGEGRRKRFSIIWCSGIRSKIESVRSGSVRNLIPSRMNLLFANGGRGKGEQGQRELTETPPTLPGVSGGSVERQDKARAKVHSSGAERQVKGQA